MRIDEVKRQLEAFGVLDGYREFATSSATVELAAAAAGCEPGRIAKTLSFKTAEGPIVIVVMGTARIDNRKFKDQFKEKAKFPQGEEVESLIGHPIGGVCPFAVNEGVRVFLDLSLKGPRSRLSGCSGGPEQWYAFRSPIWNVTGGNMG